MKILIAEDDRDVVLLYKYAIEKRQHEVITTEDGEECLTTYHEEYQRTRFGKQYSLNKTPPFDAVILDHKMPRINGMEVAKEILATSPHQRVIFASASVKETLIDSIKNLMHVVEVLQKPFHLTTLVDTIEDREIYSELQKLNVDISVVKALKPTHEQIKDLLSRLLIYKSDKSRESMKVFDHRRTY
ncbi:MAG TPA: response regulator [Candidatus Nitrosopolaris sp.]|nr:response regulator [Candidatus Nitrosopolaris sp.]